ALRGDHGMNETASETSTGQSATQIVKSLAEAFTVVAVTSYAFGFIIVNSYLLTFGYSGNALFKTTYISAGILFLLLVTPFALSIYSIFLSARLPDDSASQSSRLRMLGFGLLPYSSWLLLSAVASEDLKLAQDERSWWWSLIFGICVGIGLL